MSHRDMSFEFVDAILLQYAFLAFLMECFNMHFLAFLAEWKKGLACQLTPLGIPRR
jgi:hypothetical protein